MYRTYAIRSAILSLIVNLGFLWLVNDALSADYMTAQVGQGQMNHVIDDGWWYEHGFGVERQETGNTFTVGAGWKLLPDLNMEIDFRSLPHYSQYASSAGDEALALPCFPCGAPITQTFVEGTAQGIGASFLYSPLKTSIKPYMRAGAFLVRSTYSFAGDGTHPGGLYQMGRETEIHLRPMVGAGIEYKGLTVEATRYPNVATRTSPFRSANTVQIGWRF